MTLLRRSLVHVVGPLALGVLAYFVFRAPELRLFGWAHALGLDAAIAAIHSATIGVRRLVPASIAGSFPDLAWSYAFGSALALVWRDSRTRAARAWMLLGLFVTISLELAQAFRIIEGVFDWLDLVAMIGGYWLGVACMARHALDVQAESTTVRRHAFSSHALFARRAAVRMHRR
jgi:hypothetical protein